MAKRVRGSSRPGRRRPLDRRSGTASSRPAAGRPPEAAPSSRPSPPTRTPSERASVAPRPGGLTDAEIQRAAEIEAAMLAEERAAEASRQRSQERVAAARESAGARAIRPEQEYAYVARDVRDIVRIASLLLVILFGLWIAIDVVGVVTIT